MRWLHLQRRSTSPDDITVSDDSMGEAERGSRTCDHGLLITSCCRLRKGVPEHWFLTHYNLLQSKKEEKIMVMTGDFQPLDGLAGQTSRPSESCWPWSRTKNTDWIFDCLFFGTWNSFWQYGIQSTVKILDLRTEKSFSPQGKKDSLQGVWSPLQYEEG